MKTMVTFRSTAFNCTEPQPHFINDCCFGDDVCRWLIGELRGRGVDADAEPGQEDFGWYFGFAVEGEPHTFVVSFQPEDPAEGVQWLGWVERNVGFWKSIFGRRRHGINPAAVAVIDEVLRGDERVTHVEWEEERGGM